MKRQVVILSDRSRTSFPESVAPYVRRPREYLTDPRAFLQPRTRVINLSSDFSYMGIGHYVSLLGAARGHRVIPAIQQLTQLRQKRLWRASVEDIEIVLNAEIRKLAERPDSPVEVFSSFGKTDDARFKRTCAMLFDRFQVPLLVATLSYQPKTKSWRLHQLEPVSAQHLSTAEERTFQASLHRFLETEWRPPKQVRNLPHTLAILHDPNEELPPSDPAALKRFQRIGRTMNLDVRFITRNDLKDLGQHDALFIRETTNVNHHTFRFASQAEALGMPVIDDTISILRCTNKVFLAEALLANNVPAPRTVILTRTSLNDALKTLSFPMVLKIPDGSFSRGVVKVKDEQELLTQGQALLEESDLIIAQEFVPTTFDWRIGVLAGRPLYACQYFMARNHWQIYKHDQSGSKAGKYKAWKVDDVRPDVVEAAVKASSLMGNGLYGVDLKETETGVYVIEVNDNPSIESGVEDAILGDQLYREILAEFAARLGNDRS